MYVILLALALCMKEECTACIILPYVTSGLFNVCDLACLALCMKEECTACIILPYVTLGLFNVCELVFPSPMYERRMYCMYHTVLCNLRAFQCM